LPRGEIIEKDGIVLWGRRYTGPPHVVFGHNAQLEPQLHPWATGIDTGVVYGERLTALVPRGARVLAAALLLLAPETPLLFMGQEFDETHPFQFFTDYGDPVLQKAVTEGRRNEFKDFDFQEIPDPQDHATFERSRLNWNLAQGENPMLDWYSALIALRRQYVTNSARTCKAELQEGFLAMQIPAEDPKLKVVARIQGTKPLPTPGPNWEQVLGQEADSFAVEIWINQASALI